jgi:16S rRNA (uracil1498-N3)-methyltransferase
MGEGQEIELTGPWGLAKGRVEKIESKPHKSLWVKILTPFMAPKGAAGLVLALSLIRSSRFDWAVEKATELGAGLLFPIIAQRSNPMASGEEKVSRWLRLSEEARKQCGRPSSMEIFPPRPLIDFLQTPQGGPKFLADLSGEPLPHLASPQATLLIGPEGGFTDEEKRLAFESGFKPHALGPLTLRSETAAVAALAKLLIP